MCSTSNLVDAILSSTVKKPFAVAAEGRILMNCQEIPIGNFGQSKERRFTLCHMSRTQTRLYDSFGGDDRDRKREFASLLRSDTPTQYPIRCVAVSDRSARCVGGSGLNHGERYCVRHGAWDVSPKKKRSTDRLFPAHRASFMR
jgi:hypothetical protein